jgi:hypothetical protein
MNASIYILIVIALAVTSICLLLDAAALLCCAACIFCEREKTSTSGLEFG